MCADMSSIVESVSRFFVPFHFSPTIHECVARGGKWSSPMCNYMSPLGFPTIAHESANFSFDLIFSSSVPTIVHASPWVVSHLFGCFSIPSCFSGSRNCVMFFSVHGYRTLVHGYRTSVHGYRPSVHGYRTSVHGYRTWYP